MIESNENIETVAYLRFYSPTQIHGLISAFNPHECARIGQERPGHRGKSTSDNSHLLGASSNGVWSELASFSSSTWNAVH